MRRLLSTLSLITLAAACASGPRVVPPDSPEAALAERVHAVFEDEVFAHAHWGALIQSVDTGRIWYERNPDRLFMPASNQKILTTAGALLELGPDFTFETRLGHTGRIEGDTLRGDLVVWSNGDPTMYERFQEDSRDVFREWVAALRDQGVRRITGNIVGDDNAWEDAHIDDDWPLSNLDWWYGAPFGPLQFNEGYIDLRFTPPADPGGEVTITPNVETGYITILNNLRAAEGRQSYSLNRAFGSNVMEFRGTVRAGGNSFERSPAIVDPTRFYVTVLTEVLEEEGIEVDGGAVDIDDLPSWTRVPPQVTPVLVHHSPPLSEILTGLMKRSQNMYAETMIRTVAWSRSGLGTFREGREIIVENLASLGVEPGTYVISDGSGLSRYNYISPRLVVAIMMGMHESDHWDVWWDALPIAGVDGTLRSRMRGTAAEGNARAKTGTISNTRGLSGYVTTADGELLAFSFLVNGHIVSTGETNRITDSVLEMLAEFRRQ